MVPTDWTPTGLAGIARHEAAGRFVLSLATGRHPRRPPPIPANIDLELLACARRVIAQTAAHYRRNGGLVELDRSEFALTDDPARLTPRASRSGESIPVTTTRQEHAK